MSAMRVPALLRRLHATESGQNSAAEGMQALWKTSCHLRTTHRPMNLCECSSARNQEVLPGDL